MLPAGSIAGALYHKLKTQSSAPEDGRNYRQKHVEQIEIVNKIIIVASIWAVYVIVSMMHGDTNIKLIHEIKVHLVLSLEAEQ